MSADLTHYQRNQVVILSRVKEQYKNDKERLKEQARNKQRNLSEEGKKIKRENMGGIDTAISLKKKNKIKRISKKLSRGKKSLNIIKNKIVLQLRFNSVCCHFQLCTW